ncbi:MAG TPA: A/G-specific adenine glycosylase [Thermoanaerobaculia bacterium]|nr:A/G-specific adenine glycosylase [Thermoanaerobaculia bacterium]
MSVRRLVTRTESWFHKNQRRLPWRDGYDPYSVWVSEVMLQQTRMEVVLGYFERFMTRFPSVAALARASVHDVTAAWSGLGYYRRARMLRDGAIDVVTRFGGTIPKTVDELVSIAGIGRYTAGAIASIAHGRRAPIVDGNITRIVARLFSINAPLGSPALMREVWLRAEEMVAASKSPRDFNQGLMELGALVCTPRNPSCDRCPLRSQCEAFGSGRVDELPRPKAKTVTRELRITLYLVTDRDGRVLMRRESGRLMRDMYHLPHGDTALLTGTPLRIGAAAPVGTFRHTVTNRRITFEVFTVARRPRARGSEYSWIDPASLAGIPHPSYVRKALRLAGIGK